MSSFLHTYCLNAIDAPPAPPPPVPYYPSQLAVSGGGGSMGVGFIGGGGPGPLFLTSEVVDSDRYGPVTLLRATQTTVHEAHFHVAEGVPDKTRTRVETLVRQAQLEGVFLRGGFTMRSPETALAALGKDAPEAWLRQSVTELQVEGAVDADRLTRLAEEARFLPVADAPPGTLRLLCPPDESELQAALAAVGEKIEEAAEAKRAADAARERLAEVLARALLPPVAAEAPRAPEVAEPASSPPISNPEPIVWIRSDFGDMTPISNPEPIAPPDPVEEAPRPPSAAPRVATAVLFGLFALVVVASALLVMAEPRRPGPKPRRRRRRARRA